MARPAVDTEGDGIATTVQVLSDLGLHVGAAKERAKGIEPS
jgi:hypothetical protein